MLGELLGAELVPVGREGLTCGVVGDLEDFAWGFAGGHIFNTNPHITRFAGFLQSKWKTLTTDQRTEVLARYVDWIDFAPEQVDKSIKALAPLNDPWDIDAAIRSVTPDKNDLSQRVTTPISANDENCRDVAEELAAAAWEKQQEDWDYYYGIERDTAGKVIKFFDEDAAREEFRRKEEEIWDREGRATIKWVAEAWKTEASRDDFLRDETHQVLAGFRSTWDFMAESEKRSLLMSALGADGGPGLGDTFDPEAARRYVDDLLTDQKNTYQIWHVNDQVGLHLNRMEDSSYNHGFTHIADVQAGSLQQAAEQAAQLRPEPASYDDVIVDSAGISHRIDLGGFTPVESPEAPEWAGQPMPESVRYARSEAAIRPSADQIANVKAQLNTVTRSSFFQDRGFPQQVLSGEHPTARPCTASSAMSQIGLRLA